MRCIVVGGTKGIGKATADLLRAEDHEVVTMARKDADVLVDLAEIPPFIEDSMNGAITQLGGCDLLVLSAGMGAYTMPRAYATHGAREIMAVNFHGRLACVQAAYHALVGSKGTVLFVTSTAAQECPPGLGLYAASHAACEAWVRSEGRRIRRHFRVLAMAPGWTNTEMTEGMRAEYREAAERWMPIGRFLEPEEVATKALALCFAPPVADSGTVFPYLGEDLVPLEHAARG